MSQHTPPPRHAVAESNPLPRGRAGLVALELGVQLVAEIGNLAISRGLSHLRDHLIRAADNTVLRLPALTPDPRPRGGWVGRKELLRTRPSSDP